jgi:hypothetical protein
VRFVRWKRYGFTHVLREEEGEPLIFGMRTGGTTLCGNWWHSFIFQDEDYFARNGKGLLPPSDADDGARPLCGACRKIAKL